MSDGDDVNAKAFLSEAQQTFVNDLGEQQKFFTAKGQLIKGARLGLNSHAPIVKIVRHELLFDVLVK